MSIISKFFGSNRDKDKRNSSLPLKVRFYASSFKNNRHEYYEFLSMIMIESMGRKTILDIFRDDATRYGKSNPRGVLSDHWARKIEESGDLAQTFKGTLPDEDVNFIASLQAAGGGILESGLIDLSNLIKVQKRLGAILKRFAIMVGFAIILITAMLFAIGYHLAPEVQGSFSAIDPVYYKSASKRFFGLAEFMRERGHYYLILVLLIVASMPFILRWFTGPMRRWLDKFGVFHLYRSVQSIRFMLSLSTLIQPRLGSESISLPKAISILNRGESKWMKWHMDQMMVRMDEADIGPETFDTGLFDKEVIWYLMDMASVSGLDTALQKSKVRLEAHTIDALDKKTKIISWTILVSVVLSMIGIYLWVISVIMEMTSLMKLGIF